MPSFLTVRIYFKIPGKIYYQQYNEIITEVFFERFTITTVRGNRVMHKILKCSPVIMKNHVLNWCQWWVKLSLLDSDWSCSCFSGDRPVEELKPNLPNLKGLILHITFRYVLILRDRTSKKVHGGEPKKKSHTRIIHVRRCIYNRNNKGIVVFGVFILKWKFGTQVKVFSLR